jgi:hypothetical protein
VIFGSIVSISLASGDSTHSTVVGGGGDPEAKRAAWIKIVPGNSCPNTTKERAPIGARGCGVD